MKLVQEFSEDRGLAETKGEYTLTRNDSFSPEFKAAAFSLDQGKISDIVATPFGRTAQTTISRELGSGAAGVVQSLAAAAGFGAVTAGAGP